MAPRSCLKMDLGGALSLSWGVLGAPLGTSLMEPGAGNILPSILDKCGVFLCSFVFYSYSYFVLFICEIILYEILII